MRKAFAPLDDLLIERLFQPTSNLIADRTGLSHGGAIGFCLDAASIAWIVSRGQALMTAVTDWNGTAAFCDLAVLMLGLFALFGLRVLFRRPRTRLSNPLRPAMQPHRAVVLVMLVASMPQLRNPSLANGADMVMLIFAAFSLYLAACTEPPPLRRHQRMLIHAA